MASAFFPFNPRATRLGFLLGALGCAGLSLWALWGVLHQTERFGAVRAGLSTGLLLAFLYAFIRLRPRPHWGVTLDEEGVTLARTLSSRSVHVPWSRIANVGRAGRREDAVVLVLDGGSRILIVRQLFPRRSDFDALVAALRQKVPEPILDA